jgi:hypothetical protein
LPSKRPKDEWLALAATSYQEQNNESFLFLHCVTILHQLPKFDPMGTDDVAINVLDDEELDDEKRLQNKQDWQAYGSFLSKTNWAEGGQEVCHD